MIFNYTDNYQFSTRKKLQGNVVETVKNTKLLGSIISDNLCFQHCTKGRCQDGAPTEGGQFWNNYRGYEKSLLLVCKKSGIAA